MSNIKRSYEIEKDSLIHKVWRGHNREWIFKTEDEKQAYLKFLNKTIEPTAGKINAICMMSNHVHEIYQIEDVNEFCGFMRRHHSLFGVYYNQKHNRRGSVSESRPKFEPIRSEKHQIIATFYIHTNPLRAGIVQTLAQLEKYEYSTHPLYGYGKSLPWMQNIVLPEWYLQFGDTPEERQKYYLYLLEAYISVTKEEFKDSITS